MWVRSHLSGRRVWCMRLRTTTPVPPRTQALQCRLGWPGHTTTARFPLGWSTSSGASPAHQSPSTVRSLWALRPARRVAVGDRVLPCTRPPFPVAPAGVSRGGDLNPSRRQFAQPGRTNCRPRHQESGTQTTRSSESPFAQAVGTGRPGRQGLSPHRASCPGRREHRAAPGRGPTSRSHRDSSGTSHRRVAAQGLPGRGYPLLGDISSRVAGKVISLHWGWLHSRDYIL